MTREVAEDAGLARPGFWCERFVYRSAGANGLASWTSVTTRSPLHAVRLIDADALRMADGLHERERAHILRRLSAHGQVGAMGALQRGEPCGLILNCGESWVEWSARPVVFLPVVDRTGLLCSH